jgi:hypothetical protein
MSNTAVDELRKRHVQHRRAADAVRRQTTNATGDDGDDRREPVGFPMLLGFSDLIIFVFAFAVMWYVVKAQYNVDIAEMLWAYIKPHYDEGLFDDSADVVGGDL